MIFLVPRKVHLDLSGGSLAGRPDKNSTPTRCVIDLHTIGVTWFPTEAASKTKLKEKENTTKFIIDCTIGSSVPSRALVGLQGERRANKRVARLHVVSSEVKGRLEWLAPTHGVYLIRHHHQEGAAHYVLTVGIYLRVLRAWYLLEGPAP